MVSFKILFGDLKSTFLNKNKTTLWQDSELSVGLEAGKISGRYYWLLSNPFCSASIVFEAIGPSITNYLERHTEFEGQNVAMDMYMVGTTPETSVPTIVICCEDTAYGKAAMVAIKQSRILDAHAGVACAYLERPPDSDEPLQQLGRPYPGTIFDQLLSRRTEGSAFTYLLPPAHDHLGPGSPIRITIQSDNSERLLLSQQATVGGIVIVGEDTLLMTAAHPLLSNAPLKKTVSDEVEESGMDIGRLIYPDVSAVNKRRDKKHTHHELDYAFIRLSSNVGFVHDAAVSFTRQTIGNEDWPNFIHEEEFWKSLHGRVHAITSSAGRISGHANSTHSYIRTAHSKAFQKVYSVRFEEKLAQGDSGAWVINTSAQALCGHIVAGHPATGLAYFVPFYEVFHHFRDWKQSNAKAKEIRRFVVLDADDRPRLWHIWRLLRPDASRSSDQDLSPSNLQPSNGARYEIWEAAGTTRAKYKTLLKQAHNMLDGEACDHLVGSLTVDLYMIGDTLQNALPTVLIRSDNEKSREQAKRMIRESRILDGAGLKLASCANDSLVTM